MSNKYNEVISKIEASEELKNTIIEKMEKEQLKMSGGIIIKIKKIITAIMSLLGIMPALSCPTDKTSGFHSQPRWYCMEPHTGHTGSRNPHCVTTGARMRRTSCIRCSPAPRPRPRYRSRMPSL